VYKRGVENVNADALSRKVVPLNSSLVVSSCQPQWLDQLSASYKVDASVKEMIAKLLLDESVVPNFAWHQGLLCYKNRIWVGDDSELKQRLIYAFHDSPVGGHSGTLVTYRRLKQHFAWKGMKTVVHDLVQQCVICQMAKPERVKYSGLLDPLPVPDEVWQIILMDFIEGLPKSGLYSCILVVVDKFTKFARFLPIRNPYTVASMAKVFLDFVYKLPRMPEFIISDCDKVFTSNFWKEFESCLEGGE
jgi:hypothetical protein